MPALGGRQNGIFFGIVGQGAQRLAQGVCNLLCDLYGIENCLLPVGWCVTSLLRLS